MHVDRPAVRRAAGRQAGPRRELLGGHRPDVAAAGREPRVRASATRRRWWSPARPREPTLGILDAAGHGVDLRDCGLYPASMQAAFPVLAEFVTRADTHAVRRPGADRRAEVPAGDASRPTASSWCGSCCARRSRSRGSASTCPWLLEALPLLRVVSVNLQPEHKAVLEGEREILLTDESTLRMRVNGIDLHLRPQSFFQTNTAVAAALYRQAADWVAERRAARCGTSTAASAGSRCTGRPRPRRGRYRDQRRGGRERAASAAEARAGPACSSRPATRRRSRSVRARPTS